MGEEDQSNKIRESKMRSVQQVLKTVDAGREIVWIDRVMRKEAANMNVSRNVNPEGIITTRFNS